MSESDETKKAWVLLRSLSVDELHVLVWNLAAHCAISFAVTPEKVIEHEHGKVEALRDRIRGVTVGTVWRPDANCDHRTDGRCINCYQRKEDHVLDVVVGVRRCPTPRSGT
jgi:hypothetical protein